MKQNTDKPQLPKHIVSHWHSWHDRPIEGLEVEVMWSDNTVDDLRYEKSAFETINFKAEVIPIKWRYACG